MLLAKRISRIEPSLTLGITMRAKGMMQNGFNVLCFSAGEPDFNTPENIKQAAIGAIREGYSHYTPVDGTNELKEAIVNKFERENNLKYDKDQVCVSVGAKHTLFNIAQVLFEEGDEVIIPSPYWVTYEAIVKYAGAKPIIVHTRKEDGFVLKKEALEKAVSPRTKALIFSSPSNPAGVVYSRKDLEDMAEVALKNDFYIISDEIYEHIIYDGIEQISIASLDKDICKKTLVVNGVSKSYAMTGWRIGYLAGDRKIVKAIVKLQSQSTSNPTAIAQMAAVEALNGPQDSVEQMRKEFEERRNFIVNEFRSTGRCDCFNPKGAFYIFPNISHLYKEGTEINSSMDFAMSLLEKAHVAVVPGIGFGEDDYIRVSFATSMEEIKAGVKIFKAFISEL
ncbi:MAG: pyridoxal phosphate-dependent aminotransferase [Campylobacterota bacterium]|nr:pyridoxal phosphate-dependent aminotransferase [Campylobacterota bacterium]